MMRTYELTDEEFSTLCNALDYAAQNAVHDVGTLQFKNLHEEIVRQYEEQDGYKATESERLKL